MSLRVAVLVGSMLATTSLSTIGFASNETTATVPLPIYVTPYYDSDGPAIHVGAFSEPLRSATDLGKLTSVAGEMRAEWELLPVEAMYVAAIRFYDLGSRQDAVYWFYAAQVRARFAGAWVSQKRATTLFTRESALLLAFTSFHELSGPFINGAAFCDKDELISTLETVLADSASLPDFTRVYRGLKSSKSRLRAESKDILTGLREYVEYIRSNFDELDSERRANGTWERFCSPSPPDAGASAPSDVNLDPSSGSAAPEVAPPAAKIDTEAFASSSPW